ncbi:MAG: DUF58 domain-containing protein [Desulfobacteraceae bacterium 4572_123]|nr:MAG: DUF58 domain-containing protein [Desulfobacteraceae bacterium 4572_123]
MLSSEIIKKIRKIHIKSGRLVNTLMAGQYRSVFRGSGIEFEEVREYTPGDEVKSIDWKVSARLGRPFIKRYCEERELIVILLVDMSGSGCFGTTKNRKRETAAEVACIMAFNAIRNNDKVGAILFTDRVEKYIPPKKGSAHVWRVIREILTFEPTFKGTGISDALGYLGKVCRKRTVSFLISDFLAKDYLLPLKLAGRRHEIIGVMVSDPGEFKLPAGGIVHVQDFETGEILCFDAFDSNTRLQFEKSRKLEYRKSMDTLKSSGIDCIEVSTAGSAGDALTRYFRYRETRKR